MYVYTHTLESNLTDSYVTTNLQVYFHCNRIYILSLIIDFPRRKA